MRKKPRVIVHRVCGIVLDPPIKGKITHGRVCPYCDKDENDNLELVAHVLMDDDDRVAFPRVCLDCAEIEEE